MPRREFDLLYFMAKHEMQVFTPEQLYRQLWSDEDDTQIGDTVKSAIKVLRKKMLLHAKERFDQELDKPEFDESAAQAKAIALAAARFDALGSEDYETMRIQYILSRTEQNGELDAGLLRQIASAILIHPSGMVSLQLKSGQIMKRSDLT